MCIGAFEPRSPFLLVLSASSTYMAFLLVNPEANTYSFVPFAPLCTEAGIGIFSLESLSSLCPRGVSSLEFSGKKLNRLLVQLNRTLL